VVTSSRGRAGPRSFSPTRGGLSGRGRGAAARGGAPKKPGLRGRNARGARRDKPKFAEEADFEVPPYDAAEELEYNSIVGGIEADYNPITSLESLRGWGPGVITSSQGIKESVVKRLGTAMNKRAPVFETKQWHKTVLREHGLTILKHEEKELYGWVGKEVDQVDEATQQSLNNQWIAGHYEKPGATDSKDVLGMVGAYARRNRAYLAEDTRQFESQITALLPASSQKQAPSKQKEAPKVGKTAKAPKAQKVQNKA
jgi:hypothetical protein